MPVRDVESFARARDGVTFFANRGSTASTASCRPRSVSRPSPTGPTVALLGDLCFLHDSNGLLGAVDRGVDATFVVVDNGGGGIFSFLPQAELPEHFETLFGTPQPVDLGALAAVHGIPVTEVGTADELEPALLAAVDAGGVRVVRVRTDRDDERHPSPRRVGRGRRRRRLIDVRGERGRAAWARAWPGSRPTRRRGRTRRRCRPPPPDGRGRRRARPRAARWPTRRRRGRRPSRPDRRSGRGRSPRARGWRRARRARGVPPTAGVGCSSRASSSALGAGAASRPRIGVARCATGPNTATSGDGVGVQLVAAGLEHVDDAVDDEAVLARVLHRRRQREQRGVAVGDGGAGDGPRLDDVTHAPHEELGARADEALARVHERSGLAERPARGRCRGRRTRCRPRSAPRARARPSRASPARWRRARARPRPATRRACAAPRPGSGSAARPPTAAAGPPAPISVIQARPSCCAVHAGRDDELAGGVGIERQCADRDRHRCPGGRSGRRRRSRRAPRRRRRVRRGPRRPTSRAGCRGAARRTRRDRSRRARRRRASTSRVTARRRTGAGVVVTRVSR